VISSAYSAPVDSQTTEIIGRNLLVSFLVRDGVEVARPERDRGIDLVAYLDLGETDGGFVACPIQLKAATTRSFAIDAKYDKFTRMLFCHVWHVNDAERAVTYALTYQEALTVAATAGWTATTSWTVNGKYSTTRPSKALLELLEPYLMEPGLWKAKLRQTVSDARPRS
jgi:hypothetical protein